VARTPPSELGDLLKLLRAKSRMSQRELGRTSGISYTQIGDLESGRGGQPSPITLRAISRGLTTDALDPHDVDQAKSDAYYTQLMQAAGYLRGLGAPTPRDAEEEDVLKFLEDRSGDAAIGERLVQLARGYPDLSIETQMVVRHLLAQWVRESRTE
jgi:transcriptional regulator with XRE-family HTH domain